MRRFPWEIFLAFLVGIIAGLVYAWVVAPVRYVDTAPNTLRADFKDTFRTVIAASYAATHNLDRANARLALLGDLDPIEALTAQAQRMLASGESFETIQSMAALASDLRAGVAASIPPSPASSTPAASPSSVVTALAFVSPTAVNSPTSEPSATEPEATPVPPTTPTPRPTATNIPTASAPFELVSQGDVCNANLTSGLMQISVLDSHRHQMPGVEIDISWPGGEESFFTGLKPEIADGYADYVMQPGTLYALRVAHSASSVSGLSAPSCPDSSAGTYAGGLKLVFQQP